MSVESGAGILVACCAHRLHAAHGDERVLAQCRLVRAFGSEGGAGQFDRGLLAVAVGPGGDVFVVESELCRVQMFRPDGAFVRAWGFRGSLPGQLNRPNGVCVSAAGEVFVADTWNLRVQVFNSSLPTARSCVHSAPKALPIAGCLRRGERRYRKRASCSWRSPPTTV